MPGHRQVRVEGSPDRIAESPAPASGAGADLQRLPYEAPDVVPAGGGLPTPIAEEVGDSVPAWSPDGTQLLYAGTSRGLWLADVGGGGTVALLDDYSRDVDPDWRR